VSTAFTVGLESAFQGPDQLPANGNLIRQVCGWSGEAGPQVWDLRSGYSQLCAATLWPTALLSLAGHNLCFKT
jgi:hypothetical protein